MPDSAGEVVPPLANNIEAVPRIEPSRTMFLASRLVEREPDSVAGTQWDAREMMMESLRRGRSRTLPVANEVAQLGQKLKTAVRAKTLQSVF